MIYVFKGTHILITVGWTKGKYMMIIGIFLFLV